MIFLKNKVGANKTISVYWFIILAIVAGGIFAMVYVFYGAPYDVREIEVNILSDKVADCISRNGKINLEILNAGEFNQEFDFLNSCSFNFNTEEPEWEGVPQYFFEVEFYEISNLENYAFTKNEGNINWKGDCFVEDERGRDYERLPKCLEKRFYSVSEDDSQYLIKILSAVSKLEKNVRQ